ncbi:MAG: capsule assembly Wzi family protein [Sedimentisphaerales bacterium]|nr:capsule assembly Wzi family protein [Sedimentisphaerales bacterium]
MRRIAASILVSICLVRPCHALVSTNVPLDHWSYDAVDKLANYGLVDSAMLTIKPISRLEMARHVAQAMHDLGRMKAPSPVVVTIIDRLRDEFKGELIQLGVVDGIYGGSFVKPIENPYVNYLYAQNRPDLENIRGDIFEQGSNYRLGFASRGVISDFAAFYLHPEYGGAFSESDRGLDLIEGYGKIMAGPIEVQVGKDSLWWGPGYRGSVLMGNNAEPFTMVKITNPQPVQLPWLLRDLGPVRTEWFLTQLEEDRAIPNAKLTGARLNIKPLPWVELGASRVVMFGGRGVPDVSVTDYAKMFFALTEQAENNQLAGGDASALIPLAGLPWLRKLPLRSVKLYVEGAGEDEAGGIPSNWGALYGLQLNDLLKTGRTDFRIEYAENHVDGKPNVFYAHSLYQSGYTYRGRIIGHYMGTDSRSVFMQLSHYLTGDMRLNLTYDRQTHDLSAESRPVVHTFECDLTAFRGTDWLIEAGYRYEGVRGEALEDNHIFQLQIVRRF